MGDNDSKSTSKQASACNSCHERKIRCDKLKPQCTTCFNKNTQCVYGERLKRGPKGPREMIPKMEIKKEDHQLNLIKKSNTHLDMMLFELEFNRKMAELWQSMTFGNNGIRSAPDFRPETEAFIRSPEAVAFLAEEFNYTSRLLYIDAGNFAPSFDFATKIWQAMIQINFADLLTLFNGFPTPLLLSILEYIIVFALGKSLDPKFIIIFSLINLLFPF